MKNIYAKISNVQKRKKSLTNKLMYHEKERYYRPDCTGYNCTKTGNETC
ncbi:uncharacterized protein BN666_01562 [Bacteroides sp. CAG:462]|nr:uncharacterized protein BN666_01562 [Bacteroides sp. CAG:462]